MSKKSKGAAEAYEVTQAQPEAKGLGSDQNQAIETGQGAAESAAHLAQAPTLAGHPIEDSSAPNAGDSSATSTSDDDLGLILCDPGAPQLAVSCEVLAYVPSALIVKIAADYPDVRRLHGARQIGDQRWSVVVETAKTVEKLEISL